MLLMIPKGYERAAPGAMPDAEAVAAMMKMSDFPDDVRKAAAGLPELQVQSGQRTKS